MRKQEFRRGYRVIQQSAPGSDVPPRHGTVTSADSGILEIKWDGPGPEGGLRRYDKKDLTIHRISLAVP